MNVALTRKWLIVLLGAASLLAGQDQKQKDKFSAGDIADYQTRQTIEKVTIAATPFLNDDEAHRAFGKKLNPNDYGVLPVLVIIRNDSRQAVSLEGLQVELLTPDRRRVESTPAQDVQYIYGTDRPKVYQGPIPGTQRVSRKKNPLSAWEIPGRAFAARMLPPNETASGFFYFRAPYRAGTGLYISGLRDASSRKPLFYFEIPLDTK